MGRWKSSWAFRNQIWKLFFIADFGRRGDQAKPVKLSDGRDIFRHLSLVAAATDLTQKSGPRSDPNFYLGSWSTTSANTKAF